MAKKKEKTNIKKAEASKKEIALPIEWHIPEGLITPFATNMIIQTIENEFKISFFEIKPSIRLLNTEPFPEKVRAEFVAGVIVTADRLPNFIKALQIQLDKYVAKKQAKKNNS